MLTFYRRNFDSFDNQLRPWVNYWNLMIYLARIVFLIGSCLTTICLAILAVKLCYEPVLPEIMQGQWALLFVCLGFGLFYTAMGQYLGNDLLGVRTNMKKAIGKEYEHYRQQDEIIQYNYWSVMFSIIRTFQIK